MKLHARAPGKVNLCLFLGGRRDDGRHELVTLFQSVSLADELSLTIRDAQAGEDEVVCPVVEGPNLVSAALAGLRRRGWDAPPVRIDVVKRVPIAAGMGGGSADAAAALRLAVEVAPGRPEEIAGLAAELGADVPSQLVPGLVLGTGAGELTEPFEPILEHALLILPAPYGLATADVYREADRLGLARSREELEARYRELLAALRPGGRLPAGLLVNDLEPAAVSLSPAIEESLQAARGSGAEDVILSGSGPTVVGLFWGPGARERAETAAAEVVPRFPGAIPAVPVGPAFGIPRAG